MNLKHEHCNHGSLLFLKLGYGFMGAAIVMVGVSFFEPACIVSAIFLGFISFLALWDGPKKKIRVKVGGPKPNANGDLFPEDELVNCDLEGVVRKCHYEGDTLVIDELDLTGVSVKEKLKDE